LNLFFTVARAFSDGENKSSEVKEGRPAWMRTLHGRCAEWLTILPAHLTPLRRTLDNIKDPLYRLGLLVPIQFFQIQ
jgi:dynein heavy chain 1